MEKITNIADYVEQSSVVLNLPIDPEYYPDIVKNFTTIWAIAKLVTDFPLPNEIEAAPKFEP